MGSTFKPSTYVGHSSLRVYVQAHEFNNNFDPLGLNVGHFANNIGEPEHRVYVQGRKFQSGFDPFGLSSANPRITSASPSLRSTFKPANYGGEPELRVCVQGCEFHNGLDPIGLNIGYSANNVGECPLGVYFQQFREGGRRTPEHPASPRTTSASVPAPPPEHPASPQIS